MSLTDEESLLLRLIINNQLKDTSKSPRPMSASGDMEKSVYPTRTLGSKNTTSLQLQELLYQQMVSNSEFCDVTLLIGDVKVKAHWCVLVGCPFFQALHDSGMKESFEGNIRLNYGTPWAMKEAFKFLYTGTVEITYDKIKDLLEAAEYLQITEMKNCCNDYLFLLNITHENCVHLSLLSSLYNLDLYNKAFQYLRGHLPSVLECEDALSLTKESVMSLLTDETLTYVPQQTFLKFITKWTNQDIETRKLFFNELFLTLKLENIPHEVLTENLENNPLVSDNETCKTKVSELISKYISGDVECKNTKEVILLCGGGGPGIYIGHYLLPHSDYMSLNNLIGYVIDEKRWTKFSPMPSAIRHPLIVCDDNGNLFIYDKSQTLEFNNYIYKYTTTEKEWSGIKVNLPENSENLHAHSMVLCQNKLFLLASGMISKLATSRAVKSWQCFLLEVNKDSGDSTIKSVLFPRNSTSELFACKIGSQYICVIGSKLGDQVKPKQKNNSVCVCYDVIADSVSKLPKGCNSDQFMFDYNGSIMTARPGKTNVRVYSTSKKRWETRRDLAIPLPVEQADRTDYVFTHHNNEFFIFGGKSADTKEPLKGALVFSHETKAWEKLEDVPEALFGGGTCVGKLPSSMVRCHLNCPHCVFKTPRSQATYNCLNTEMDMDDDDDDEYSLNDSSYNDFYNSDMWYVDSGDDDDDDDVDDGNIDRVNDYWFY